jgi:Cu-processing system ATP-binding protein
MHSGMISIKEVSKTFGKLTVLDNVCIELSKGKSYALVGPNGSGKTTLIKCILGMVIPSSGEISIDSVSIENDWRYREKIGYMPQVGHYPQSMTIGQIIDMMKNIRKNATELDEDLIEKFKLYKIYDKRMHTLSGGTRQKVSAALAFLFNPPVLILDEPTAGLDPVSVEVLKEKILEERQNGKLIIVSSHILSDLDELTTELLYLFDGRIHFNNTIASLKEETSEPKLGKAVATMISQRRLVDSLKK